MLEELVQIGLTQKEAQVYLALLQYGPSPASTLGQRTGLKRVTTYSVLESLKKRSLVAVKQSPNGRVYVPLDPETLLYDLEKETVLLKNKLSMARDCVSSIQNIQDKDDFPPEVQFFSGRDEVETILNKHFDYSSAYQLIQIGTCDETALQWVMRHFKKRDHDVDQSLPGLSGLAVIQKPCVFFFHCHEQKIQMVTLKYASVSQLLESVLKMSA